MPLSRTNRERSAPTECAPASVLASRSATRLVHDLERRNREHCLEPLDVDVVHLSILCELGLQLSPSEPNILADFEVALLGWVSKGPQDNGENGLPSLGGRLGEPFQAVARGAGPSKAGSSPRQTSAVP